jgi:hypothetical protein
MKTSANTMVQVICLFFCVSSFFSSTNLHADAEKLTITLWCELEPFILFDGDTSPLSEKEIMKRILEEARIIFSAMIYGYSFTYIPYDKNRQVDEFFHLEPLAEIAWGDPGLEVIDSEIRDKRMYMRVSYRCREFQTARIEAWKTLATPSASGRGSSDYFKGYSEKITSLKNAIKEGIRGYMRKRTFNKPREISGEVLLDTMSHTIVHAGEYITTTKIKLHIKTVIPYKVY